MTASEGPKIFHGTDLNSTLVVTLPLKPQQTKLIIERLPGGILEQMQR